MELFIFHCHRNAVGSGGILYSLFTSAALRCSGWGSDHPFPLLHPPHRTSWEGSLPEATPLQALSPFSPVPGERSRTSCVVNTRQKTNTQFFLFGWEGREKKKALANVIFSLRAKITQQCKRRMQLWFRWVLFLFF